MLHTFGSVNDSKGIKSAITCVIQDTVANSLIVQIMVLFDRSRF